MTLELEVLDGPIPTTFADEMATVERRGETSAIVQSTREINQPPFKGFSMVADLNTGKASLDSGVVRRFWLGTEKFHLSIYAKVKHSDSEAQSEAMDAMVASIVPL